MVTVITSPKVHKNFPPTIIAMIASRLEEVLYNRGVKAKRKWLENIDVGGSRYAVSCHELGDDKVEITQIRTLKKPKYSKSGKKEKRLKK